jgi:hypothetical protein
MTKNATKDSLSIDSLKVEKVKVKKHNRWDTLYVALNKDAIVLGDSATGRIDYVLVKFQPLIYFSDFSVDSVYNGIKVPVDLKSNKIGLQFKTVITETYKYVGVNFAGHYCLVNWGCGSPCQYFIVVDVLTGKIYNGVDVALGLNYKANSRMLIVNPPDSSNYYFDCPYCKPLVYIFDDNNKKFILRQ